MAIQRKVYLRKDTEDDMMFILEHATIYTASSPLYRNEVRHADALALLHIGSLSEFCSPADYKILNELSRGMRVEINLDISIPDGDGDGD